MAVDGAKAKGEKSAEAKTNEKSKTKHRAKRQTFVTPCATQEVIGEVEEEEQSH